MKKVTKRALAFALVISMAIVVLPAFASSGNSSHPFIDVSQSDWYNEFVQNVWKKGIIKGTSENEFEPAGNLTRGMLVTILGRLSGVDVSEYTQSKFIDVDSKEWYAPYVAWASENKIANGVGENKFAPDEFVTREQLAAFIHRYINFNGCAAAESGSLPYTDAESFEEYSKEAVIACKSAGIMQGNSDKTFLPKSNTTRAEAAAVVTRVEEYINSVKKDPDTYLLLNEYDQKKVVTATNALRYAEYVPFAIAKWIYYVAFSTSWSSSGTEDKIMSEIFVSEDQPVTTNTVNYIKMVAPGLYSGEPVANKVKKHFYAEPKKVTQEDLIIGDFILQQKDAKDPKTSKVYIYIGDKFVELKTSSSCDVSVDEVLSALTENEYYLVLRPSMSMKGLVHALPEETLDLTPEQAAIIGTAEAYVMRGDRIQYDDGHISPYSECRWQHSLKAPEEYTKDDWGYTNCAAFAHDVYLNSIGYDKMDMYASQTLINAPEEVKLFYYETTGQETEEEKAAIEAKFYEILQPADIIVTRHNSNGHVMIYVGNGNIIHATGASYSYDNMKETYEPTARLENAETLFAPSHSRYIFSSSFTSKAGRVAIVRPLKNYDGKIPENTINRITTMKGIFAEKLSSHKPNQTVNPGEEIDYSFFIYNSNNYDVTLEVEEVVPEHTTYVKGAEKVEGNNLSWIVNIPAGKELTIEYTVKVDEDTSLINNATIRSEESTIGGVKYLCHGIAVKRTLTSEEKAKITESANKLKDSEMTAFDLANEIYKDALGKEKMLSGDNYNAIGDGVFYDKGFDGNKEKYYTHGCFDLKREGRYYEMVVPSLYGGRGAWITPVGERTRLLREIHLIPGDIVLSKTVDADDLYIYTNDGLLNLNTGEYFTDVKYALERLLGKYPDNYDLYFAVLRPSFVLE